MDEPAFSRGFAGANVTRLGRRGQMMTNGVRNYEKLLTAAGCCIWKGAPLMLDVLAAFLLELQYGYALAFFQPSNYIITNGS